ncbi:unnamed protein product, partial [Polarella glacialis]
MFDWDDIPDDVRDFVAVEQPLLDEEAGHLQTSTQSSTHLAEVDGVSLEVGDDGKHLSALVPEVPSVRGLPPREASAAELKTLRWMMQKVNLRQDMFLLGPPGPSAQSQCNLAFTPALSTAAIAWKSSGYSISQQGQAQESGAMLCSIVLVAILGSVYGRKLVLMIGLAGTTSSVALFVLAGSFPEWARFLFVLGQGLQGLLPIDHIAGLIIFDLSTRHGGDGFSTYQVAGMLAPIGALLWGPVLGNFVQYLELVDYNGVWQVIFIVNAAVLILAAMMMPESAPRKKEKDDQDEKWQGPVAKVVR